MALPELLPHVKGLLLGLYRRQQAVHARDAVFDAIGNRLPQARHYPLVLPDGFLDVGGFRDDIDQVGLAFPLQRFAQ